MMMKNYTILCLLIGIWAAFSSCKKEEEPANTTSLFPINVHHLEAGTYETVDLLQLEDGGFLVLSDFKPTGSSITYLHLVRLDAEGEEVWTEFYGNVTKNMQAKRILDVGNDEYLIAGNEVRADLSSSDTYTTAYISKIDAEGTIIWESDYAYFNNNLMNRVLSDITFDETTNTVFFTGYTEDVDNSKPEYSQFAAEDITDIWTVSLDVDNGGTLWSRVYGFTHEDKGVSIVSQEDGDILVIGTAHTRTASTFYTDKPILIRFKGSSGNINHINIGTQDDIDIQAIQGVYNPVTEQISVMVDEDDDLRIYNYHNELQLGYDPAFSRTTVDIKQMLVYEDQHLIVLGETNGDVLLSHYDEYYQKVDEYIYGSGIHILDFQLGRMTKGTEAFMATSSGAKIYYNYTSNNNRTLHIGEYVVE